VPKSYHRRFQQKGALKRAREDAVPASVEERSVEETHSVQAETIDSSPKEKLIKEIEAMENEMNKKKALLGDIVIRESRDKTRSHPAEPELARDSNEDNDTANNVAIFVEINDNNDEVFVEINEDHVKYFETKFVYILKRGRYYDLTTKLMYRADEFLKLCYKLKTMVLFVDCVMSELWLRAHCRKFVHDITFVQGGDRFIPHDQDRHDPDRYDLLNEWTPDEPDIRYQTQHVNADYFRQLAEYVHPRTFTESFLKPQSVAGKAPFRFDWDMMYYNGCCEYPCTFMYEKYEKGCGSAYHISSKTFASKMREAGLMQANKRHWLTNDSQAVWAGFNAEMIDTELFLLGTPTGAHTKSVRNLC
jgi:hypothetical protein